MRYTTRIDLDVAVVRRLIDVQFPQWRHLAISPVTLGGWDNRTFHLGDTLSVRLPSAERYADKVSKEQHWLPWLAPQVPLPIPTPLAIGVPGESYPWPWAVYQWIDGETADTGQVDDRVMLAHDLAQFLKALHSVNASGGLIPGQHNFYRGGSLRTYDAETRKAIRTLGPAIDEASVRAIWERALSSSWQRDPVWVHGDISSSNLLVRNGRLSAVIDFGGMAVGDPACDLAIAWTYFEGASRDAFRRMLGLDSDTWSRGRGWALWKALITLDEHIGRDMSRAMVAWQAIVEVLADGEHDSAPQRHPTTEATDRLPEECASS